METVETHGDPQRPAETSHRDHGDMQRPLVSDWLMLPTTANDIIGTDFDWLMLPTTTNKIIGIKNLCKPPTQTMQTHADLKNLIG